jgi:hypothetical protein
MVTTRPNLGRYRFRLTQTFSLIYCIAHINLWAGLGSLGWVSLATGGAIILKLAHVTKTFQCNGPS